MSATGSHCFDFLVYDVFVFVVLIIQIVIYLIFTTKLRVFEVKIGVLCDNILLDHHDNVSVVFFYDCRSA